MATSVFSATIEAETFAILDNTGSSPDNGLTVVRDPSNPESNPTAGPNGLWSGFTGTGYLDMGGQAGDAGSFSIVAPEAGEYRVSFRYANGSSSARPMTLERDGLSVGVLDMAPTGAWNIWGQVTLVVGLPAGTHVFTLANEGPGGPNLDAVTIEGVGRTRVEAETLDIASGFIVSANLNGSGGAFLQASGAGEQRAGLTFAESTGLYAVSIRYFDETDGVSRLGLRVNGVMVDAFLWDDTTGTNAASPGSARVRTLDGVFIEAGATVELVGYQDAGEPLRVDYLEFSFIGAGPSGAAPVNVAPAAAFVFSNNALAFNDGWTVTVSDADSASVTTTLKATNGALSLGATTGAVLASTSSGAVSISGTAAEVNAALAGLTFTPDAGYSGQAAITIKTTDGALTDTDVIVIDVVANVTPGASIATRVGDPAFFENRLHFSYIDEPATNALSPRAFKDSGVVTVSNDGSAPLKISGHELDGPFDLANPSQLTNVTLQPGQSIDVTVLFDRTEFAARINNENGVFNGALRIFSNDESATVATVDLSGFWQRIDEGGWEPNINEIWEVFGFGNRIPGLQFRDDDPNPISNGGRAEAFDATEVISPFWKIADGVESATLTSIATYSGPGSYATVIHRPYQKSTTAVSMSSVSNNSQSILPEKRISSALDGAVFDPIFNSVSFTRETIPNAWPGSGALEDVFAIAVAGNSTENYLNPLGNFPNGAPPEDTFGHWLRIFQALDAQGNAIENVYLGVQDFVGINGDFNDNMFVIEGVAPVSRPPEHSLPAAVAVDANGAFAFTGVSRVNVTDPDVGLTLSLNSYLSVQNGVLTIANPGTATVTGSGTANLAVTGSAGAVSNALASLIYTPNASFSGQDQLRIVTNDRTLSDEDFIAITVAPTGGAAFSIVGLDDVAPDDRLAFSAIDRPGDVDQSWRSEATLTLKNLGSSPISIQSLSVDDPSAFKIVGPIPTAIPAGAAGVTVTIRFIGTDPINDKGALLYESALRIETSAGARAVALAGLAQFENENGDEATITQVVRALGFGTDVAETLLPNGSTVETVGDEVLAPYFERLNDALPVEIVQIGAFLGLNDVSRLYVHGLEGVSTLQEVFAQNGDQTQTVLPRGETGNGAARGAIAPTDPFGIYIGVDDRPTFASWSDPEANLRDPAFRNYAQIGDPALPGLGGGHLIRYFTARNGDGAVIPGTYIGVQDYPGAGNYDYNDHMFVISNVRPYALSASDDTNGDGVNDALQRNDDNDDLVAFFDADETLPAFRVEAEDLALVNFEARTDGVASGDMWIQSTGGVAAARYTFTRPEAGLWSVTIGYFDENDGVSEMWAAVNGVEIDRWLWNRNLGSSLANATTATSRTIENVALQPGDVVALFGRGAGAEPLRTDYLDFALTSHGALPTDFRVEAETFTLVEGFVAAGNINASGGAFLQAGPGGGQQRASYAFEGANGVYDLRLGYVDENDGVATMMVLVNGLVVDSFLWDADFGTAFARPSAFTEREILDVALRTGDVIELRGRGDGGEPLRTDYLDFAFVSSDTSIAAPPAPPPFRLELEAFDRLEGFVTAGNIHASGGIFVQAGPAGGEQRASTAFLGADGLYRLEIGHFDENDGVATLALFVNGAEIGAFAWDQTLGSAFANASTATERAFDDVALRSGDIVELRGRGDGGEPLRTDYVDFIYTDQLIA